MSALIDLTGSRFSQLTVLSRAPSGKRREARWLCLCSCGHQTTVASEKLRTGKTKSCGCYGRRLGGERLRTHGMTRTPEFRIWQHIRERCSNPNTKSFKDYGARGITVCDEWRNSFLQFYADMGQRPSSAHSIERKNNDGPYSKENCEWATCLEQNNNTRDNFFITFHDRTQTLAQWAREIGIKSATLRARLVVFKWPTERAFSTPVHR